MGAHSSVDATLSKLGQICWWPSLENDVRKWVTSCSVCRAVKPQPGLAVSQRMELHDRPFKVLFIDTVGPISPPSNGCSYIYHCECPFSRWPWVHAAATDTAEEWAKWLVEEVFFDIAGFLPSYVQTGVLLLCPL